MSQSVGSGSGHSGAHEFAHDALLVDSPADLAGVAGPWLREGLDAGDSAVIASATGRRLAARCPGR